VNYVYAVALPAYAVGVVRALSLQWFERGVDDMALMVKGRQPGGDETSRVD
jgi:hypothetical protein